MSEKFFSSEQREHTRIANELDRLIIKLKATGQEVRHASLAALGRPVEGVMMRPEVFELSQKISEALQHGYTEAQLAELIKELEEDEITDSADKGDSSASFKIMVTSSPAFMN